MTNTTVFDLKFQEEEVKIRDKNGIERVLLIREMSGEEREEYLRAIGEMTEVESGSKENSQQVKFKSYDGLLTVELRNCLFWKHEDGTTARVTDEQIKLWPYRVIEGVTKIAKRLNGLDEEATKEAEKN